MIKIFEWQPDLESLHNIHSHSLPLVGTYSMWFQRVLSPDNRLMLLLQTSSHSYLLPLVGGMKDELPYLFGKVLRGKFCLLQADWGLAFGSNQVR